MSLKNFELGESTIAVKLKTVNCTDFETSIIQLTHHDSLKSELLDFTFSDHSWMNKQFELSAIVCDLLESHQQSYEVFIAIFLKEKIVNEQCMMIPSVMSYFKQDGNVTAVGILQEEFQQNRQRIVREQRIDPHQLGSWSITIFEQYIDSWLGRNGEKNLTKQTILDLCKEA